MTHGCSHTILAPPLTCSLRGNNIGVEGASALAAILKETMISDLECAAALAFAFLSAPIDTPTLTIPTPPLARSLGYNKIGDEGASALAAILKETKITSLGCAATRVLALCMLAY